MTFSLAHLFSHLFSFRVANFIWMVGISIYAFKRWVLPGIHATMMAYKKQVAYIRSTNQDLQVRYDQTLQATQSQDLVGKDLFIKITTWNNYIDQKKAAQEQEWRSFDHALKLYGVRQRSSVEQLYLKRDIQHEVYTTTQGKLRKKYESEIAQREYIQNALLLLTKGVS